MSWQNETTGSEARRGRTVVSSQHGHGSASNVSTPHAQPRVGRVGTKPLVVDSTMWNPTTKFENVDFSRSLPSPRLGSNRASGDSTLVDNVE